MIAKPTRTYTSLDAAYDHFNRELFGGQLPPCLITMQRHKGAYGYFSGERFASLDNPEEVTDEIALNPAHFASRTPAATLSTLVHEMCHLWQHHFGKPSRSGYHNKEWAAKMREVGLIPIDTGQPGGKDTGQKVTHYHRGRRTLRPGLHRLPGDRPRHPLPRPGRRRRSRHPQEESRQQDQIHLPGMRAERLGEARRPPDLRRLRRGDGGRGCSRTRMRVKPH